MKNKVFSLLSFYAGKHKNLDNVTEGPLNINKVNRDNVIHFARK